MSERPFDPHIVAALFGDRAGEFSCHQGGGSTPEDRGQEQEEDCHPGSSFHDRLKSECTSADAEIDARQERPEPEGAFHADIMRERLVQALLSDFWNGSAF